MLALRELQLPLLHAHLPLPPGDEVVEHLDIEEIPISEYTICPLTDSSELKP